MGAIRRFAAAVTGLALGAPAHAVDIGDLGLSESQVRALNAQMTAPAVAPGIAFGSPVGFGAGWGQAFLGVGGTTLPPGSAQDVDGSASFGMGFGDPYRNLGLEAVVTSISLRDSFGDSGDAHFKVHHALPFRASFAIGVESTGRWGDARSATSSTYVAYTQVIDLAPQYPANRVPLSLNLGFGDGRFVDPGEDGVGAFASVAIAPLRQMSLIADWTGRDANAAVSLVPARRWPVVLTAGAVNLAERNGNRVEFAGGLGVLLQF
jgi:hypothetical protein